MKITSKVSITEVALRDADQSIFSSKMRTNDMTKIATKLDRIGYWSVECWGEGTFDACMRGHREDPWERLRRLKEVMTNTRLQMSLRGQNLLGFRHFPDDVVDAFIGRSAENGIDVFRIFDALNDFRNLRRSVEAVCLAGKHAQGAIAYTMSPIHSSKGFIDLGIELEKMGCHSVCLKDAAGYLTPQNAYDLIAGLKANIKIPVCLHIHATTGIAAASILKAIEAGCDIIDSSITSFGFGSSHVPTEAIVSMFAGTRYDTEIRPELIDEIASELRSIRKRRLNKDEPTPHIDARAIMDGIPAPMRSDIEQHLASQGCVEKLDDAINEAATIRKELGYPPLVMPVSQIIAAQASINVIQGERYKTVTSEAKDLFAGRYGKLPSEIDYNARRKAIGDDDIVTNRPADLLAPKIAEIRKVLGQLATCDEDALSYAITPKAALKFFKDREHGLASKNIIASSGCKIASQLPSEKEKIGISIDGKKFALNIEEIVFDDDLATNSKEATAHISALGIKQADNTVILEAPLFGRVSMLMKRVNEEIEKEETALIVQSAGIEMEIKSPCKGTLHKYYIANDDEIAVGEPLFAVKGE